MAEWMPAMYPDGIIRAKGWDTSLDFFSTLPSGGFEAEAKSSASAASQWANPIKKQIRSVVAKGNSLSTASHSGGAISGAVNDAITSTWDKAGNFFERGTVIVLGLIFVAVGLTMLKGPAIVSAVTPVAKLAKALR